MFNLKHMFNLKIVFKPRRTLSLKRSRFLMLKADSQTNIGIINCAINPRIPENTYCFSADPNHQLDQLRPNSPPPPIYLANLAQNCSHRRKHRQIFQKNVLLSNFRATSKSFWGTIVASTGGLPMPK